jgi:hypothetical protein
MHFQSFISLCGTLLNRLSSDDRTWKHINEFHRWKRERFLTIKWFIYSQIAIKYLNSYLSTNVNYIIKQNKNHILVCVLFNSENKIQYRLLVYLYNVLLIYIKFVSIPSVRESWNTKSFDIIFYYFDLENVLTIKALV